MKHRIRLDLCFPDRAQAAVVVRSLVWAFKAGESINAAEPKVLEVEMCYHDEENPEPCELLIRLKGEEEDAEIDRAAAFGIG